MEPHELNMSHTARVCFVIAAHPLKGTRTHTLPLKPTYIHVYAYGICVHIILANYKSFYLLKQTLAVCDIFNSCGFIHDRQ